MAKVVAKGDVLRADCKPGACRNPEEQLSFANIALGVVHNKTANNCTHSW